MDNIDYQKLRQDLIDYFGAAMHSGMPIAMMSLMEVKTATCDKLLIIARKNGFDLSKYYIIKSKTK